MYQTDALDTFILLIGLIAGAVPVTGLITSIAVFYNKSIAAEVIAWICGIIWFLMYLFFKNVGIGAFTEYNFLIDFSGYLAFLIFFLLLQYRADSAHGTKLKRYYIAKTVLLMVSLSSIVFKVLHATRLSGTADGSVQEFSWLIVSMLDRLLYWIPMLVFCLNYLKRTNQPLIPKPAFKTAVRFIAIVYLLTLLLNMGLFSITHLDLGDFAEGRHATLILDRTFWVNQIVNLLISVNLVALTAVFIYTRKNRAPGSTAGL